MTTPLAPITRYGKRYHLDRARGVDRSRVPTEEVATHLRKLIRAGATQRGIATVAAVSPTTVGDILTGTNPRVQRPTATALLAVTIKDVLARDDTDGFVPRDATVLRIQALLAIGWRHADISTAIGGDQQRSATLLHQPGEWVTAHTHRQVATAYEKLRRRPGPSAPTAARAHRLGYQPPELITRTLRALDPATAKRGKWVLIRGVRRFVIDGHTITPGGAAA